MKKTFRKFFIAIITVLTVSGVSAQENISGKYMISNLERLQDENMDYLNQIYRIIEDYPTFSYSYDIEDGKVQDVVVTGVENKLDKKRLEVTIFDLNNNKNMMKAKANRIGVFYSPDEGAEYEKGWESLESEILTNVEYPDDIKNWGLEGTVFVQFIVNEEGEIPFLTTSSNMESTMDMYVDRLEEEAADALISTSGDWEPGKVEGVDVASMVVVPVTFDLRKDPSVPVILE